MYLEADRLDGKTLGYLYSAARCEHKGGRHDQAIEHDGKVIANAPAGDPLVEKSTRHKATCQAAVTRQREEAARAEAAKRRAAEAEARKRAAAEAKRKAEQEAEARRQQAALRARSEADAWRRPTGWATIAVGVAAVGAGVWMLSTGSDDLANLEAKLAKRDASEKIIGITYEDATQQQEAANRKTGVGAALVGAGLLSGGLGAWLVWTSRDQRVTVQPFNRYRGVRVTMRF